MNTIPDLSRLATSMELAGCAAEPIHIPGSIQPHGVLLVLDGPEHRLVQASANAGTILRVPPEAALGHPLRAVLAAPDALFDELLASAPASGPGEIRAMEIDGRLHEISAHRLGDGLGLELEATDRVAAAAIDVLHPEIRSFVSELQHAGTLLELADLAARHVRRLIGFDRVLVYRFDESWNGTVVAEDGNGVLPSYLDLRFPASDIPEQARELYRTNRLRLIADAGYQPVPLVPADDPRTGLPTDLSGAALRSVSPVHLEYMRNMGTAASMSISIVEDGRLWGLISCHNAAPLRVPAPIRAACEFLGQIVALQLAATRRNVDAAERIAARERESRLLGHMAAADHFVDGLVEGEAELLALTGAAGAAILSANRLIRFGTTPNEDEVRRLAEWLWTSRPRDGVYATNALASEMPGGAALCESASGVVAIAISQIQPGYILWFRPEVERTVRWAGDPRKAVRESEGPSRLRPRTSFEAWKETVRQTAEPWSTASIEIAGSLRNAIVGIVLRRAEELAQLNEELTRSNKELEAFSYSISHDLRAPFRHIVGFSELLREHAGEKLDERSRRYVATVIEAAQSAGRLVDDLLGFSRMGRQSLNRTPVDMNRMVAEVRRLLALEGKNRRIEWEIEDLPAVTADATMMRQVVQNLVSNAIKYTRNRETAHIRVSATREAGETIYRVADDGIGFDMAYAGKLFGVFQRLHRIEEFEGTGIGLANVRRILERHGGRCWAEGRPDEGATFYFALPREPEKGEWQG